MKVRIGQIEVSDVSLEELDELVRRYGGGDSPAPPQKAATQAPSNGSGGSPHQDNVLLKKFVDGGEIGVDAKTVGEILGRRGKATRNAIRDWSKRIGLGQEGMDAFDPTRIGTKRGFRLKNSLMEVARSIAGEAKN